MRCCENCVNYRYDKYGFAWCKYELEEFDYEDDFDEEGNEIECGHYDINNEWPDEPDPDIQWKRIKEGW